MKLNKVCDQSENAAAYPAQTHVIAAFLQLQKLQQLFHSLKHEHENRYRNSIN